MNKGHNQKGKGVLKKTSAGKRKTNERQRDHLWGRRGRISYSDPQLYQKMCCSLFSHASLSPSLSFRLSLSISLFLSLSPLSWPFNSLKRYHEGGGGEGIEGWKEGGRVVLSSPLSLVPAEQKHQLYHPVCVCVCVCVLAHRCADINNYAHLFTSDSAVNNLNSFPFENRLFFL